MMKIRTSVGIIIVSITLISGCLGSDMNQEGDLELVLKVIEKEIQLNDTITFTLTLVNNGVNSVRIKPFDEMSGIGYTIIQPDGNLSYFDPTMDAGARNEYTNADLITLEPGKNVSISRSTSKYYGASFDMLGNYTFQVHYVSKDNEKITKPFWHGELSVEETIRVIE